MAKRLFPSRTAGSGSPRANSAKSGSGQGKSSRHLFAPCRFCGFPIDVNRTKTHGGTDDGNGARGAITKTSDTGTLLNGETFTETYGDAATKKGAGCPVCHSPDSVW